MGSHTIFHSYPQNNNLVHVKYEAPHFDFLYKATLPEKMSSSS